MLLLLVTFNCTSSSPILPEYPTQPPCAGSGWNRVNFLHSSLYVAMFWIYAGNIVDNRDVFITAEQCLHRVEAFSASQDTPPVSRLGVHTELGGDTARTGDPRDIPHRVISCSAYKAGERRSEAHSDGVIKSDTLLT